MIRDSSVLICDTRDDDRAGGHIVGSVHYPDAAFDAAEARRRGCYNLVFQ
jgi:hypothetical protein